MPSTRAQAISRSADVDGLGQTITAQGNSKAAKLGMSSISLAPRVDSSYYRMTEALVSTAQQKLQKAQNIVNTVGGGTYVHRKLTFL